LPVSTRKRFTRHNGAKSEGSNPSEPV